MNLTIIIPTYNEVETITRTVERALAVDPGFHVLVVDDNSPDGTAKVVEELASQNARVSLLLRTNDKGFGTAVRDGFLEALRRGAVLIGQMDADGSHDPAMLGEMKATILRNEADVVIGSRYLNGSTILGWGPRRYANSYVANWLARLATGLRLADATNGLRLFRREVLENLELKHLLSPGYSVILETNYRAFRAGYSFKELPITFHPRIGGESKMGFREIVRFTLFLLKLRKLKPGLERRTQPLEEQVA
jgi:dolichol-phosphate mannosyltransferase